MDKIALISEIFLFAVLLTTYFYISTNKERNWPKWIVAICSVGILGLADRIKLLMWVITVGFIFFIQYFHRKKQQHGRTT